jgi:hypothetical protein
MKPAAGCLGGAVGLRGACDQAGRRADPSVRSGPAPELSLPVRLSIRARGVPGNWRRTEIAAMGKVFLIGLAIAVATLIGMAVFVFTIMKRARARGVPRMGSL